MKYLLLMMILIDSLDLISQSQPDILPHDTLLIKSLIEFHTIKHEASLLPYSIKSEKPWLKYLPSIGLAYNLQGQPRPSISYNPISIITKNETEKLREAEKHAIIMDFEIVLSDRVGVLLSMTRKYRLKLELWKLKEEISLFDDQLMKIVEEKYRQDLIKPSQYISEKKRVLQAKENSITVLFELNELFSSIIEYSKFNFQIYSAH